jgi:16S rRNA (guanine527-N7)-methyltransferase
MVEDGEFRSALESSLANFGLEGLSRYQINQLVRHYSMLRRWNRRMNLTRIIEPGQAARLHYCESLYGSRFTGDAKAILDIGSGAGFPAIPLAVLRPDREVTALEANNKKTLFLNEAKEALGLANLKVAGSRLEAFDCSAFDLLTSRALDRAEDVLPAVISSLIAGQRFMLYCTHDLISRVSQHAKGDYIVEAHPIPQSESRIIAIFNSP